MFSAKLANSCKSIGKSVRQASQNAVCTIYYDLQRLFRMRWVLVSILCLSLNITVFSQDSLSTNMYLEFGGGSYLVGINVEQPVLRQNYAMYHRTCFSVFGNAHPVALGQGVQFRRTKGRLKPTFGIMAFLSVGRPQKWGYDSYEQFSAQHCTNGQCDDAWYPGAKLHVNGNIGIEYFSKKSFFCRVCYAPGFLNDFWGPDYWFYHWGGVAFGARM